MIQKTLVFSFFLVFALHTHAAKNRPDGYTTLCKIDETCTVATSTNVAFGAADLFVYKVLSGTFVCSVSTFGSDPNPEKSVKECSIPSGTATTNTNTNTTPTTTSNNNQSLANGRYAIVSRHSGLSLDVENTSTSNGANIIQWEYWGGSGQQFDVNNVGNGFYSIRAAHSGKSLDVFEFNPDPGGEIRQWEYLGGDNQQWQIAPIDGNYYGIISRYSWLALDVWAWSTANGGDIRQWTPTNGYNQQWRFDPVTSSNSSGNSGSTNKGSTCVSTGSTTVTSTIYVTSGVFDGGCKTFNPTSALGDGSQSESQDPVFRVENGATLRNVIIGNNGADGIHIYNGGTVENVRWTNVGEDALTIKSQGNVTVRNIEGYAGSDKFFQVNAPANLTVSNCLVDNMGKFLRQNGGTTFTLNVTVDNCDISNMKEGIFRSDSPNSSARITNSRVRNAGDICIGQWKSCTSSGISNF